MQQGDSRDGTFNAGRGYPVKQHQGGKIGKVQGASFPPPGGSGPTDSAAILLVPEKFRSNVMMIYRVGGTTTSTRSVGPRMAHYGAGNPVCGTGQVSGEYCGEIERRTAITKGFHIYPAYEVDLKDQCTRKGDSGGPVYVSRDGSVGPAGLNSSVPKHHGDCTLETSAGDIKGSHRLLFVPITTAMNQVHLELNRERRR